MKHLEIKEIFDILSGFRARGIMLSLDDSGRNVKVRGNVKDLSISDKELLKQQKDEIILLLKQTRQAFSEIKPISIKEHYTLSSSQRRLWLLSQFEEAAAVYHIPFSFTLEGEADEQLFARAFNTLITRHESLRTIFTEDTEGEACQVILQPEHSGFSLSCIDLRHSSDAEKEVEELMARYNAQAFNLTTGPLIRAALVRIKENKWVLHCVLHHIISDGWSVHILVKELFGIYDAYSRGEQSPLSPLRIQYKDYAAWQQEQLSGEQFTGDKAYWLQQFEGELPVLELPVDRARPRVKTYNGALVERQLPSELGDALAALSQKQGGTLFMGLLAAVKALLYHYSGQTDIITGTPIAGREHADLEGQIGFFLNTLALRTRFNPGASFRELLEEVKETTLGAFAHQSYPFEEVVENLHLQHDRSRNPLFDVLVILQNTGLHTAEQQQEAGGLKVSVHKGADVQVSKFDLTIAFIEAAEGLQITIEYNTDIYNKATIERMAAHLERLIGAAVAHPETPVEQLDYLSEEEKHHLLVELNDTTSNYPRDISFLQLVEEQVARTPEATAVLFEDKALTYKELDEQANQLAHYLRSNYTLQPEDIIGVQLQRSEKLIVALMAVLKSGAAYVPIDPEYPQDRIDYMISDSGCKLVIDEELLSSFMHSADKYSIDKPAVTIQPTDLAYVVYTSGSTGRPKGVMAEHRSPVAYICWCMEAFRDSDFDTVFLTASVCFDLSVMEIFYTLSIGKKLRVLNSAMDIPQYLHTSSKIMINTVPSVVGTLLGENVDFSNIAVLTMGGEPIPASYIRQLDCERMDVRNLYGPTEDTVYSTSYKIKGEGPLLIGRPNSNTQIYFLGSGGQLVPAGVVGEVCISSPGVARGYLNKPELTAEKFVPNPFRPGERMYKTGDLGRWLPDGNIELLGRKDNQVKIRGQRIELGEIENTLRFVEGIEAAVGIAKPTVTGDKELVAYLVSSQPMQVQELRSLLAKSLPAYMIPTHFVQLDELPLMPNGKVDRKRLPEPEGLGLSSGAEYVAPQNEIEEKLAAIWQGILGKEKISVKDDFFALGGHSLRATRLVSQIHKTFDVKIDLKDLFELTMLEEQARLIERSKRTSFITIEPVEQQADYTLSSSQRRLWVLSQFQQANIAYNMPGVYVFEGRLDHKALEAAFALLIERHESLRTTFRENEQGEVRQFIHPANASGFSLRCFDLRSEEGRELAVKDLVRKDFVKPFDLSTGPLLRASLYRMEENSWVFSYVMHHIISDGWSMNTLIRELLLFYNAIADGKTALLEPLRIQYKDYATWQQQQLQEETFQTHKQYWLKQFEGKLPVLQMPADRRRPAIKTYNGGWVSRTIGSTVSSRIKALCSEEGGTLFMGLLAAVNTLLYRYSHQEDIIIGSPIAGREHADLQDQIGFYVNTLALRTRFSGSDSFRQLLQNVRQLTLDAYSHQSYPFEELVDSLQLQRDMSRSALFDVMVVLQNTGSGDATSQSLGNITVKEYADAQHHTSKFDLLFTFVEQGEELGVALEYNSDIYSSGMAERLATHLVQLLEAIVKQPSAPVNAIEYLAGAEREQLLVQFNDTAVPYADRTVMHLFEEQADKTPTRTALVYGDKQLTYRELNERSNQLARYIQQQTGIRPGDCMAMLLDRSEWSAIAMIAIMKLGCVYVPIDKALPASRIGYMLAESSSKAVVVSGREVPALETYLEGLALVQVEDIPEAIDASDLEMHIPGDSSSYIIYTSGSTGKPKGVEQTHRMLYNLVMWDINGSGLNKETRHLQFSSFSFDSSLHDIYYALATGGEVHILSETLRQDFWSLKDYIVERKITTLSMPYAALKAMFSALSPSEFEGHRINEIISTGEQLYITGGFRAFLQSNPSIRLHNLYGPSETHVVTGASYSFADGEIPEKATIGKPVHNTCIYILDAQLRPVPIGVEGEAYIGGWNLAKGYQGNPEMTREKFIEDPFSKGALVYRSGDICKWLPNGEIEYIMRRDNQLKINGYRVEPEEVENALRSHEHIEEAVVVPKTTPAGDKELVAYMVGKETLSISALRSFLGSILPSYLVPSHYVQLEALPLTPNGKVDKAALPSPEGLGLKTAAEYVAPRNETERKLVLIWQEVLAKEKVGVKDNFFELGGHSLKATRMVSQVHRTFDVKIELKDFFEVTVLEEQAQLIDQSIKRSFVTIEPTEQREDYALSSSQRRLWVLSRFEEANLAYNIPGVLLFEGSLDHKALEAAFASLIERHESLRTIFREDEQGEVRQIIRLAHASGFTLSYRDFRNEEGSEQAVKALVQQDFSKPFNLSTGPLLRASLYQVEDSKWVFSFVMHHIISDGWSMNILIKELLQFYSAHAKGETISLQPLRIHYKDYAAWQQQQVSGEDLQAHKNYWLKQFEGELPVLELPADKPRPAVKTFNGRSIHLGLGVELSRSLKAFSQQQGGTLFMGILAAVNALLYRYTGQQDIIIGSPIAGREHADLEDQIGFYLNTLALRSRFSGSDSFRQLLDHVKEVTLDAYEHQVYPFDELVDNLNLRRDMSRSALFDVLVMLQNNETDGTTALYNLNDLRVSSYDGSEHPINKFDLEFEFTEEGEELRFNLNYNSDIYSSSTAERLAHHLRQLLSALLAEPQKSIQQLNYLNREEEHQLLRKFNDTSVDYALDKTIVQLFEEQVQKTPEHIALQVEYRALSYKELNYRANQLARFLEDSYGITAGDFVGIKVERTEWMVIAQLAVLKTGAAYIPIDPEYPQERIEYMISNSGCKLLIGEDELTKFRQCAGEYSRDNIPSAVLPSHLAYIIYTSGSTGQPKGVMVRHRNLSHFFANILHRYTGKERIVMPFIASNAFDISVFHLFTPLLSGGTSVLVNKEDIQDMNRFTELLSGTTFIDTVPGVYHLLVNHILENNLEASFRGVEKVFIGGDSIPDSLLQRLARSFTNASIVVTYGPTEGTIFCTDLVYAPGTLPPDAKGSVIGSPMGNISLYILDQQQRPVPVGVKGEICIAGHGLTKGYLNRPELTAEKYINVHLAEGFEVPVYRTGDMGRWLPDGTIEFAGRSDHQVKIRGYRIEIGEIESTLQAHAAIDSAVVAVWRNADGERELVAYLVGREETSVSELRAYLGQQLPFYMVPDHFVQLDEMPLTSNGKIDRSRLPDPDSSGMSAGVEYVAPRNKIEQKLQTLWQQVLGKENISVKSNFFDLGGHSLKLTRLASRIHKEFAVQVELKKLFEVVVLEEQAKLIGQSAATSFAAIEPVGEQEEYALSSSQRRLWVLSQFEEANVAYNMPGVYVFEGTIDRGSLEAAFESLIERHEILRTTFRESAQGGISQLVRQPEASGFSLHYFDLRSEEGRELAVKDLVQRELALPFDLAEGPLLRASLYQMEDSRWVFSYVMHHIISDGWSMNILIKELLQLYAAHTKEESNPLTRLRIQYKDYAAWQQQQLSGENLEAHRNYWLKQFEGELPVLELPAGKSRPAVKTYNGNAISLQLNGELSQGLKALSQQQGGTLFMGLIAAVNTLLYKYTGQEDIILGSPIAGRAHADLEDQIGFYLNTLALRSRFSGEQSFHDLLEQVKQVTLDAYEHQVYPFDELVEALELRRDLSRSALFDVMVVLQNTGEDSDDELQKLDDLRVSNYGSHETLFSKFDLTFTFSEAGEDLQLMLTYNSDIYEQAGMQQLVSHLEQLVSVIIREPQKPIQQLDYLEEKEKQLLTEFSSASVDYPKDKTIVSLFEEQAERTPDATAVVFAERTLTYQQLNEQANQLAHYLITNYSIAPDNLVAVKLERSEWMIVALLGILKSGGAYVAIDLEYPEDRVSYMLEDSRCKLVIDIDFLEAFSKEQEQYEKENPATSSLPSHLAYVLYTSGSTGKPKGVMIEHRSLVDYCFGLFQNTNIRECRTFGLVSTLAADLGNTVLFPSLISGGALHIFSADDVTNPEEMLAANLDCIKIVPSHWKMLQSGERVLAPHKMLVFGGEQLTADVLQLLKQNGAACKVYNHYGPSETTVGKLLCPLDLKEHTRIPLGSPFCNSGVYILDSRDALQPVGVIGEICISGDGLARGYLNKPELTAEKFITIDLPGGSTRIYRTGDLGRWLPDGTIEFLGRSDDQVKIRGYRIELGEIENALLSVDSISAAVVMARTFGSSEKELVAYIVAKQELTVAAIRAALNGSLPAFMIPSHYVLLEQLPLTANGKVDRKRLPDPEGFGLSTGVEYVEPRNEIEKKLVQVWEEVLGREKIGINDNFFDLGGHSLKAIQMISRVNVLFHLRIDIRNVFREPTIENLAYRIDFLLTQNNQKQNKEALIEIKL